MTLQLSSLLSLSCLLPFYVLFTRGWDARKREDRYMRVERRTSAAPKIAVPSSLFFFMFPCFAFEIRKAPTCKDNRYKIHLSSQFNSCARSHGLYSLCVCVWRHGQSFRKLASLAPSVKRRDNGQGRSIEESKIISHE